jgi:hypothetical protein
MTLRFGKVGRQNADEVGSFVVRGACANIFNGSPTKDFPRPLIEQFPHSDECFRTLGTLRAVRIGKCLVDGKKLS